MAGRLVRAWRRHVAGDDPRLATSFAAGVGFTLTLTLAALMADLRSQLSPGVDLGIFAVVVALAGWWMSRLGALVTAVFSFLMLNGFVVDRYAVLRWHGRGDLVRLVVLLGCAGVVSAVRELQLRHRRRAANGHLADELAELTGTSRIQGAQRHA